MSGIAKLPALEIGFRNERVQIDALGILFRKPELTSKARAIKKECGQSEQANEWFNSETSSEPQY